MPAVRMGHMVHRVGKRSRGPKARRDERTRREMQKRNCPECGQRFGIEQATVTCPRALVTVTIGYCFMCDWTAVLKKTYDKRSKINAGKLREKS